MINEKTYDSISQDLEIYLDGEKDRIVKLQKVISNSINVKYDLEIDHEQIIITNGATDGINIILKSILVQNDEIIIFKPYYMDYINCVEKNKGEVKYVDTDPNTFIPDLLQLEKNITYKTKAVIINTPNNPTGVIYPDNIIESISYIIDKKQKEYKKNIYIISDEPYREIIYDINDISYIPKYYKNTFVVYSYSKSIPNLNQKIGYIVIPKKIIDTNSIYNKIIVNKYNQNLMDIETYKSIVKNIYNKVDISLYEKNRNTMYNKLIQYGYKVKKPEGTFFMFVKLINGNEEYFIQQAEQYKTLLEAGSKFGFPGYIRVSFCVEEEILFNIIEIFAKVANELNNKI